MVPYRAMLDVPHEVVEYVSWLIYARRRELRSGWRRLSCFQQAVLVLVHLRKNATLQQVGVGFGVSTAAAGRYVTEAVDVLADHAPTLLDALHHHDPNELLILDGILIRTDRVAVDNEPARIHRAGPASSGPARSETGPADTGPPRDELVSAPPWRRHPEATTPAAGALAQAASRTPAAITAHVNRIAEALHSQEASAITGTTNIEWTAETANAARAQPPPVIGRRTVAQWRHHSPAATAAMPAITAAPSRAMSASVTLSGSSAAESVVCTLSATAVHPRAAALSKQARTAVRRRDQLVSECTEFGFMPHLSQRSSVRSGRGTFPDSSAEHGHAGVRR